MKKVNVPIVCARDNGVTRFCTVIRVDGEGDAVRIFDGCIIKDGSPACARCHESMQEWLQHNPSAPEDSIAAAYNARQNR